MTLYIFQTQQQQHRSVSPAFIAPPPPPPPSTTTKPPVQHKWQIRTETPSVIELSSSDYLSSSIEIPDRQSVAALRSQIANKLADANSIMKKVVQSAPPSIIDDVDDVDELRLSMQQQPPTHNMEHLRRTKKQPPQPSTAIAAEPMSAIIHDGGRVAHKSYTRIDYVNDDDRWMTNAAAASRYDAGQSTTVADSAPSKAIIRPEHVSNTGNSFSD